MCNGNEIKVKTPAKYVGANLDQEQSRNEMWMPVVKKVNKCLKYLYRKGESFTTTELLFQSLYQPQFDYACNVWFRSMGKHLIIKLQNAQNKLIRYFFMYDSIWRYLKYLNVENSRVSDN